MDLQIRQLCKKEWVLEHQKAKETEQKGTQQTEGKELGRTRSVEGDAQHFLK